jgi:ABC-2 type transport system permease protein
MTTLSNSMGEARMEGAVASVQTISVGRQLYWSVQRELWENRAIYLAPLAVAGLIVIGFLMGSVHRLRSMLAGSNAGPVVQTETILSPYEFAAALIMGTTLLVAIFYCLSALHGERRDRSILFWKSLPVSDLTTVMAKAMIPIVVIPLVTFAITIATQSVMAAIDTVTVTAGGLGASNLWANLRLFQMWLGLLYHLVTVHAIWYAPMFAWLLLASAWAKRLPILWAILPPAAIAMVEKIAFNTSYFAKMLGNRIGGGVDGSDVSRHAVAMGGMRMLTPGAYLTSAGLWVGLALTAVFLGGAVQLRRLRGPI